MTLHCARRKLRNSSPASFGQGKRTQPAAQAQQQSSQHQGIPAAAHQNLSKSLGRPSVSVVSSLILLQALAIVGAFVGGWLARQRRLEVEKTNRKLRHINNELRKRQHDDLTGLLEDDLNASQAARTSMEKTLAGPSAAHPTEGYGSENVSLATARRQIASALQHGKRKLQQQQPEEALELFKQAGQLSEDVKDKRAARAIARATAAAHRETGDLNMCLRSLAYSLELSAGLQDTGRDSDVLGEMADVYTDMGDLEKAGQFYDKCITAMASNGSEAGAEDT